MADAVEVEPPRATRRSQRAARATPSKEPQPPLPSALAAVPVAVAEAEAPAAQSPTKQEIRKEDGDTNGNGEDSSSSALLLTPTRNRRPSRRQLEVDAPTEKAQLLLGAFSASDATALCEVVWYQLKENSHRPDVLLRERSPARIDWHRVAERLARSHEIALTPRACQRLWKFLAYAQDVGDDGDDALLADSEPEDYELTADKINARRAAPAVEKETTDLEKLFDKAASAQTTTEDSTQHTGTATPVQDPPSVVPPYEPVIVEVQAVTSTMSPPSTENAEPVTNENAERAAIDNTEPMDTTSAADPKPTVASATTTDGVPEQEASAMGPRETLRTAGIQLYPRYDQPSGVPNEFQNPFDVKRQMPLVFVAEKFLRRKVVPPRDPTAENSAGSSMEVDPSILAAAAMSVTLTGEKAQPKPKKKRASEAGGEEKKPKKPRKKKEPATAGTTLATTTKGTPTAAASAASTAVPLASKSPAPIRQSYVPSPTAPPSPTPARPALDFFGQLYRENPSILRASGSAEEKTETPTVAGSSAPPPSSAAALDAAQIEAIFINAPLHVRAACEQMASDDLRRFEREQLRRRLWEKARASLQNSPAPSPAASQARAAPPPTPATVVPAPPVAKAATSTTETSPTPASTAPGAPEASQVVSNTVENGAGTTSQTSTPEVPGTQVS